MHSSFTLKLVGLSAYKRLFIESIIKAKCTAFRLWNCINITYFLFQSFALKTTSPKNYITLSRVNLTINTQRVNKKIKKSKKNEVCMHLGKMIHPLTSIHTFSIALDFNFHNNMQTVPNIQTGGWFNFRFRSMHSTILHISFD